MGGIALVRGLVAMAGGRVPFFWVLGLVAVNAGLFGGAAFVLVVTGAVWQSKATGKFNASPWLVAFVLGGIALCATTLVRTVDARGADGSLSVAERNEVIYGACGGTNACAFVLR